MRTVSIEILIEKTIEVNPNTKVIFDMFDPIMLPKVMSVAPLNDDCMLTKSSGEEVAKDTIVIPTTKVDIFIFEEIATALFTKNSPPRYNITKLNKKSIIIDIIFLYLNLSEPPLLLLLFPSLFH